MLLSLVYDIFDAHQQSGIFNIVSSTDKKLVLEPYGKLRIGEDEEHSDIIDKDSYCVSRVANVNKFFSTTSKTKSNSMGKLISLILSFSVALCVMLVLLLMNKSVSTIILSFILTLSFTLIISAICESEFAFWAVVWIALQECDFHVFVCHAIRLLSSVFPVFRTSIPNRKSSRGS